MKDLGDRLEDSTIIFHYNTTDGFGESITPSTSGTIKVVRDDGTDCTTGVVTYTEDDLDTGIHKVALDTSQNANIIVAHDYTIWLDGAVIDGKTVNAEIASFSIENRITSLILNILEADTVIDISGTPWIVKFLVKGTATEIMRKQLKDINGNNITAGTVVVGQHIHTASP